MGKNVELYSENELAAMQIKALRRIATALEKNNEFAELVNAEYIAGARARSEADKILPEEKTKKKTGGKDA